MKNFILTISFILSNFAVFGQSLNNFFEKDIIITNDSIYFDTLSIVPESFSISLNNQLISPDKYKLNYAKALLIFNSEEFEKYKQKKLKIKYRTFPLNFSEPYSHKQLLLNDSTIQRRYISNYGSDNTPNLKAFSGLKKSGSISRGITIGNNQNAALNSDFNLQLSGKISPDIEIQANITDSNIPIQADGSSQNLREFDNVFIRLISKKSLLEVGDLNIKPKEGYFMKFDKKVKGANFMTSFNTVKNYKIQTQINAAVSKGSYNKMIFNGTEGNQGPYRLTGKNGELYIIILSGSEKIYLDGKILIRGNENDYVINYNSGELSFTSKRIITKDSRIIAEFEYSEMNYARFTAGSQISIKTAKTTFFLNLISEQDAKNNSLQQNLSDEQKLMFHNIGDDIKDAFVSNVVYTDTFNNNEVLYRKTDTVIQSIVYQDVYIYSTNPDNAKYRVNFSYTGEHKGNYRRIQNGANGKVFQWIEPINGILQGDYEPIKLLISPKKKQMINAGASGKLNKSTSYYFETALTNNDLNTFSDINDNDNIGYAFRGGGTKNFLKKDTSDSYLTINTNYQFTNKHFDAFEPYKSPEFQRDWNLLPGTSSFDEHSADVNFTYFNHNFGKFGLSSDLLLRNNFYSGYKNDLFVIIDKKKLLINLNANRLTTKDTVNKTEFIRYKGQIEGRFSNFKTGIINSGEKNIFTNINDNILSVNSFRFNEFEVYLKTPENSKHLFSVSYVNREDFLPFKNHIAYASTAHNLRFVAGLLKLRHQKFNTVINFRKLYVKDSILTNTPAENTLSGKFNYSFNFFKGTVSSSSFVEHTSGNEAVKEFSYLEVQSGQGIFAWKDFNNDKIKELNEFVKANFSDEANYIRIALPSSEYRTVYNQSVFEVFNLLPNRIWSSEKGLKKFISLLSNRFTYKINRKINSGANYFNFNIPDSTLITQNKSLKNRFAFNLSKYQMQIAYTFINSGTKNLLINGIDIRKNIFHSVEFNKTIKSFIIANIFKSGNKKYESEYFSGNNFSVNYIDNNTSVNFKIDKKSNIKSNIIFKKKNNLIGEEKLISYTAGGEYRFSSVNKGSFQVNFDFVKINYIGKTNTAVSYEILEGLLPGKNFLWSVLWYKKLTKYLQLELNYSGRKSDTGKIIHTGGMSIRAFF
ncbi:MAG: hypothetical protein GXO80_12985 [Chlorobi bacterium]|nr:hypothetical protein [Chlorobiota bacterium]